MKKINMKIFLISCVLAAVSSLQVAQAQWTTSGSVISQTDTTKKVSIGTKSNTSDLYVYRNNAASSIGVRSGTGNAILNMDKGTLGANSAVAYKASGVTTWNTGLLGNNNYSIKNVVSGTFPLVVTQSDNVGIGTTSPASRLSIVSPMASIPALSILPAPGLARVNVAIGDWNLIQDYFGTAVSKDFSIYQSSTGLHRILIDTLGRIGIGTNSPAAKLDVAGSVKITDGSQAAGKVLTSDANGLASWQVPTGGSSWGLTGNAGTTTSNFIGTTDNMSLRFRTNNTEKLIIDSLGKVGIGTSVPKMPLTVGYNTGNANALATSGTVDPSTGYRLNYGDVGLDMGVLQFGGSYIQNRSVSNLATSYPLLLQPGGGNVSIGGTQPYDKLHVVGGLRIGGTNASNGFRFAQATGSNMEITYNTTVPVSNIMTLGWAGGVAIGTTTFATGYQLTVAGKIICTELKVQLQPFPDYVFAKDYNLKSIGEVEDHIKTFSRLPGMPSACEVEEGGLSVGEMTGKVVEKVEENTLYIIQLNKENQSLKAQLNDQAKAIQAMQAQLDALKK